jgi:hypothetical protein
MGADIGLVFRRQSAERSADTAVAPLAEFVPQLVGVPDVVAARAFAVNVVLGDRTPAFYPELLMFEIDGGHHDAHAAVAALAIGGQVVGLPRPDGLRFAAWDATSIGARDDFELPDHLYLQFSAHPASLSFDAYSDWYQVHQDENIAQSAVLQRGWRYRLEPVEAAAAPGPTHLALYQLEGTLERLTSDLGAAMEAGVISLPDWFTRFASLEAIALGERVAG